uniref:Uncharacterized protein n=1 Tax=Lygus hesperus TaxID=30085 RepID=A0A0A9XGC2_LYGHE
MDGKKKITKRAPPQEKQIASQRSLRWTEDESLPSQVVLAHQVLKKVKLAPQRTWSEDSQGSPPREVPEKRPPVPPKRKHRPQSLNRNMREQSASPPTSPMKRERKLPPHLQKEFERVYAQMGDREPSPETIAASRRIKALAKLGGDGEETPAARASRRSEVAASKVTTRKPSRSPRRRERESRTPSTVREVTPRTSITPEPYPPRTSKSSDKEQEERRNEERLRKEEELRRKEEELIRRMEELKKREEEMKREEERREKEDLERRRREEEEKRLEEERRQAQAAKELEKTTKVEWGRELSHDIHSSSEMMLVLLPNNEEQVAEDEPRMTAEELKEGSLIAPPMSLSAPVLGGCEMPPPSLRAAVSSTEIMYELAMARLNKDAEEEEAEENLRLKYGLDRKRSFERKGGRSREDISRFKETTVSLENLSKIEEDFSKIDGTSDALPEPPNKRKSDTDKRETNKSDNYSERFLLLEKSFENYNQKFDFEDLRTSDAGSDILERSFDYYDDVEEDTYSRMNKGVFTPIAIQLPTREFAERVPSVQSLGPPPLITISEEGEKDGGISQEIKSPEKVPAVESMPGPTIQKVVVRETISPDRLEPQVVLKKRSPSPKSVPIQAPERLTSSPTNLMPKPILKTRDRSAERSDRSDVSDSESTTPKRVRIEEPNDKKNIDHYAHQENDMGLQAGEVARNRRKQIKPQTPNEEPIVVVNIYSDIIREFSHKKKPQPKLYLNYEELKEAAEKTLESSSDNLEEIEAAAKAEEEKQDKMNKEESDKDKNPEESARKSEPLVCTLPKPKKLYMEYLLDLFLFFVAVWLYLFKDPRLTIPILMLMVFRQLDETLRTKIVSLSWFKRKEE